MGELAAKVGKLKQKVLEQLNGKEAQVDYGVILEIAEELDALVLEYIELCGLQ